MVTFTPKGLILPDPPTILINNLLKDPRLTSASWSQQGSSGTLTHYPTGGPLGLGYFEYVMSAQNTSSPMQVFEGPSGIAGRPVVEGTTYNISGYWHASALPGGTTQRYVVTWYNAIGGNISTTNTSSFTITTGEWNRQHRTVVAPAGAVYARVSLAWSGTYSGNPTLAVANAQLSPGSGLPTYTDFPVTDDDGDFVQVAHLNANLDRASQMGVGGMPVLSSERPGFGTIDDEEGTIIYETDTEGLLFRRAGNSAGAVGVGSIGANWRNVVPGVWRDWASNNIWSGWLTGDNNVRKARYMPLGRLCFVHIEAIIGAGGDITNGPGFASSALAGMLPLHLDSVSEAGFTADDLGTGPWPIGDAVATVGGSRRTGRVVLNGNSVTVRTIDTTSGGTGTAWSSTVPANWAVGDSLSMDFCYYTS